MPPPAPHAPPHVAPHCTAQVYDAFGTVRYSSPEMALDIGIGQRTDVWSAGVVLYFLMSGVAPFLKRDEVDTLNYIKKKPKVGVHGGTVCVWSGGGQGSLPMC